MDNVPGLSSFIAMFIVASSVAAVHFARDDPSAVAFALFSFGLLFALFACLRAYEGLRDDDRHLEAKREKLKAAIWVVATTLSFTFSFRIAALMPFAMAAVVWVMTVSAASVGFYALFL
ncbi:uncharacterized protein [Typha angustifolia]|uniref:uncharacterized protein isoform X1 n=1 Tax=Typha angustifolia TaxID=59011 RepID=UPI003C2DE01A